MASGFGGRNGGSRPYRKRKPLPALIVIGILGLGAIVVWVNVMVSRADVDDAIRCEPPASPPPGTSYTSLGFNGLDGTTPAPPDKVAITVLNAGSQRGQAAITTEALRQIGFTQVGQPGNDPAFQDREAKCKGQLRFGENGRTAARTVSLVLPCVELIKDGRQDATVDLSVGNEFGDVLPTREATQVLQQLAAWSQQTKEGGGEGTATQPPALDPELVRKARDVTC